ncbi:MAG: DUF4037 domain-containing protein [Anaerolineae bacterium]|nr:DUF4037 domain-containing protein [Anaerolineae bacterium]
MDAFLSRFVPHFSALESVRAVALAGSRAVSQVDDRSDYDIYIYADVEIPCEVRRRIALTFADRVEIDNRFWEPGDEWGDVATGLHVDIMYRSPEWIEAQLDRVLVHHEGSVGYSTCFWHNVLTSQVLFDRAGWFAALQVRAGQPYPEPLRRAIIAKNQPILRKTLSSYIYQLSSAVARGDTVSMNHRTAALLASYFDILFAVNRLPHPGEKRLLATALNTCRYLPVQMAAHVTAVLHAAADDGEGLLPAVHVLLDGLDALLGEAGLLDPAAPEVAV